MDPLLFADHLRTLRAPAGNRPRRGPGFNVAGAARLALAVCAACLVVVTLHAALSQPFGELAAMELAQAVKGEAR